MLAKGFYSTLAFSNLKRNRKIQLPYFFALTITICMYYLVLAILKNPGMENIPGHYYIKQCFSMGNMIITIFAVIVMFYLNDFFIKQRKREFGLYNILGLGKGHICRLMLIENFYFYLGAAVIGFIAGIVFGKMFFLILLWLVKTSQNSQFELSSEPFIQTLVLFTGIFCVTALINIYQIYQTSTMELLKSGKRVEKKLKGIIIITIIGLLLLGWGYYKAIFVENYIVAIQIFFPAVIAVIIATYCLFTSGSIFLLEKLRKNKKIYYQINNFAAISGMFARMKQNAIGLASICILSTMVLVTASSCAALYFDTEESIKNRYVSDATIFYSENTTTEHIEENMTQIQKLAKEYNANIEDMYYYFAIKFVGSLNGNVIEGLNGVFTYEDIYKDMYTFYLISETEYNRACNSSIQVKDNEMIIAAQDKFYDFTTLDLLNTTYQIKEQIFDSPLVVGKNNDTSQIYLIFSDKAFNEIEATNKEETQGYAFKKSGYLCINYSAEKEIEKFSNALKYSVPEVVDDINYFRMESYSLYGGLVFIGVFFVILFIMTTILIIYFKQISEGYEDKKQFEIMQKVGMDDKNVKKTINKQILIVFFLPLAGALMHTAAASKIIIEALKGFQLYNTNLVLLCILISCIFFAGIYILVFRLTARAYYQIVRW